MSIADPTKTTRSGGFRHAPATLAELGLWPRIAVSVPASSAPSTAGRVPDVIQALRSREAMLVLALSAAWYAIGVWYLLIDLEWYDPDTLSRLANAFYVLFSREPHVAAIGFVWPPLLGAAMLPLLLIFPWWPSIASHGIAAGLLSAAGGTLFATVTFALLRAAAVPRWARWAFTIALLANPMWWYASTNGLSEMPFLLLLLVSTLLLWQSISTPDKHYLAVLANGCICAAGLMIRYEMVAWAAAASAVTLLATLVADSPSRGRGWRFRAERAQAFTLAFALPWMFTLVLWVFFNWQIVGNPLYFLTSTYSNVAQTGVDFASIANPILAPAVGSVGGAIGFVLLRAAYLNPALFVCLPLATVLAFRRGGWHGLALVVPALAVLTLDAVLLYRSSLNSLLRYHLFSAPATIVLMVWLYRVAVDARRLPRTVLATLLVGAGCLTAVTSAWAMADTVIGHGTREVFQHMITGTPSHGFNSDRSLAAYVDGLGLADGSVLIDSANGYGVIISSQRPKQFVINSDSDYLTTLAHPQGKVQFVALGPSDNFDVITTMYPKLFQTGEPLGTLEREFVGTPRMGVATQTIWRLFRISAPESVSPQLPNAGNSAPTPKAAELPLAMPDPATRDMAEATELPLAMPVPATRDVAVAERPTLVNPPTPLLPGAAGRTLLDTQFVGLDGLKGWPYTPGIAWLDASGYRLSAGPANQFVAVSAPLDGPLNDVVVSARFHKVGGPSGGGYGLIVSDQSPAPRDGVDQGGSYTVFEVGDRGEFGVWRREQMRWIDLVSWTAVPAGLAGHASNELEVRVSHDHVGFVINGALVADWQSATMPHGSVGAFLGGDLNEGVLERFMVTETDGDRT